MLSLSQENRASVDDLIQMPKIQQMLPGNKLRQSVESEKLRAFKLKEQQLVEKEAELCNKETKLRAFELELV
jgi:hypothetical protein